MAETVSGQGIEVIPVLDLMGGLVVRGQGGDRAEAMSHGATKAALIDPT